MVYLKHYPSFCLKGLRKIKAPVRSPIIMFKICTTYFLNIFQLYYSCYDILPD
jgi:hypothetical protein